MVRSLAVAAFIASVGAAAFYMFERPTVAHGDVLAADLMRSNAKVLASLDCDPEIPIGVDGAHFWCLAQFGSGPRSKLGAVKRLEFKMDRAGNIRQIGEEAVRGPQSAPEPPRIDKSDPWE